MIYYTKYYTEEENLIRNLKHFSNYPRVKWNEKSVQILLETCISKCDLFLFARVQSRQKINHKQRSILLHRERNFTNFLEKSQELLLTSWTKHKESNLLKTLVCLAMFTVFSFQNCVFQDKNKTNSHLLSENKRCMVIVF